MPITKRPSPSHLGSEKTIVDFIQGAPDAKSAVNLDEVQRASTNEVTEQITLRIPKAMLQRATNMAERQGIGRASYIRRALALQLQADET